MTRFNTYPTDHFEILCSIDEDEDEDDEFSWQIDYDKTMGMCRVTLFENNHFKNEVIFDEVDKNGL